MNVVDMYFDIGNYMRIFFLILLFILLIFAVLLDLILFIITGFIWLLLNLVLSILIWICFDVLPQILGTYALVLILIGLTKSDRKLFAYLKSILLIICVIVISLAYYIVKNNLYF